MQNRELFAEDTAFMPLAARIRPAHIEAFYGQAHLLAAGKPLAEAIRLGKIHSMILWGPPGTGKTTLAKLLAQSADAHLVFLSAVLAGVKEVREVVEKAKEVRRLYQRATILFVDEVHRFNKAQQDAFLPYVEDGTLTFIGATTENPSFALNNALLSRTRVYVLKRLTQDDILKIIKHALTDQQNGFGLESIPYDESALVLLAQLADGDARSALNLLEIAISLLKAGEEGDRIDDHLMKELSMNQVRRFDKQGDYFYEQISALHKAIRGSDPDASLYWLARMLDGGCDPLYISRRLIRLASEDIGNADPRALTLALEANQVFERLGSPEGELAIAQAVVYCACAAKSNAVYMAFNKAMEESKEYGTLEVPMHLRNAPSGMMKHLGYGKTYRYAHDEPHAYAAGENYFPEGMAKRVYYQPVPRGLEAQIAEKLAFLNKLDAGND